MSEGLPAFLTVEEAGAVLRIGRTKAYAMAKQWRDTDGRSGLPVVDLGDLLRVPRKALEHLAGGELDAELLRPNVVAPDIAPETDVVIDLTERAAPEPRPARRSRRQPTDQPGLFDLPPAS